MPGAAKHSTIYHRTGDLRSCWHQHVRLARPCRALASLRPQPRGGALEVPAHCHCPLHRRLRRAAHHARHARPSAQHLNPPTSQYHVWSLQRRPPLVLVRAVCGLLAHIPLQDIGHLRRAWAGRLVTCIQRRLRAPRDRSQRQPQGSIPGVGEQFPGARGNRRARLRPPQTAHSPSRGRLPAGRELPQRPSQSNQHAPGAPTGCEGQEQGATQPWPGER